MKELLGMMFLFLKEAIIDVVQITNEAGETQWVVRFQDTTVPEGDFATYLRALKEPDEPEVESPVQVSGL